MLRRRNLTRATALLAGLLQHTAFATAGRTRLLDTEESSTAHNNTVATAGLAGDTLGTSCSTATMTFRTLPGNRQVNRTFATEKRFVKINVKTERHIVSVPWSIGITGLMPSASAEEITEASKTTASAASSSEEVAEHGEDIVHVHTAGTVSARTALKRLVTELIVTLTFFGVVKDVIRLRRLLELLLCLLVTWITIRMILHRKLTVGGLDLVRRRRLAHSS